MFAHARAITLANFFHARPVLIFVDYIDDQSRNLIRLAASFRHNRNDIRECAIELFDEVVADDLLIFIPADLARDKEPAAAGFGQHAICVAVWRAQ